jgi:hypothetical protein
MEGREEVINRFYDSSSFKSEGIIQGKYSSLSKSKMEEFKKSKIFSVL